MSKLSRSRALGVTRKKRSRASEQLSLPEAMESRLLLANSGPAASVLATLGDGRLTITGTEFDDTIEVRISDTSTIVRASTRHGGVVVSGSAGSPFTTYAFPSPSFTTLSLRAGAGDDVVAVTSSRVTLGAPDVSVAGNNGDDIIEIDGIDAIVSGDDGNDVLAVTDGRGTLSYASAPTGVNVDLRDRSTYQDGFGHQDQTRGFTCVVGSPYADTIVGSAGNDVLDGGEGNDVIEGGAGDDILAGGEGDDSLAGGAGDDAIDGGTGRDEVTYKRAIEGGGNGAVLGVSVDLVGRRATGEGTDTLVSIEDAYGSAGCDVFTFSAGNRVVGAAGDDVFIRNGVTLDTAGINPNNPGELEAFVKAAPEVIDLFTEFWDEFQSRYVSATASLPSVDRARLDQSLMRFFEQIAITPAAGRFNDGLGLWGGLDNTPFDPKTYRSTYDETVEGVSNVIENGTEYAKKVATHWEGVATRFGTDAMTFILTGTVTIAAGGINIGKNIWDACVDFYTDLATAVDTPDPIIAMVRFGGAIGVFVRNVAVGVVNPILDITVDLGFQFWAQAFGRPLNRQEKEIANAVFGYTLDLTPIRVVSDSGWENLLSGLAGKKAPAAQTLGQSIYLPTSTLFPRVGSGVRGWDDFDIEYGSLTGSANISTLVHELAHVLQKQRMQSVTSVAFGEHISQNEVPSRIPGLPNFLTDPWDEPPGSPYHLGMSSATTWADLGIEAQARAIESVFVLLETVTSLGRVTSIAESAGYTLRDALEANTKYLAPKGRSAINPNLFPAGVGKQILLFPEDYAKAYRGGVSVPRSGQQPYTAWNDFFRVVVAEGGVFHGLFHHPWPGFLSRGEARASELNRNLAHSPPGGVHDLTGLPSLDGRTITFEWTTPKGVLNPITSLGLYYRSASGSGSDWHSVALSAVPGTKQSYSWSVPSDVDWSASEFYVYAWNDFGPSPSTPARIAMSLAGTNVTATVLQAAATAEAAALNARRPAGRGFRVAVDAARGSVSFIGDQLVGSGGGAGDVLSVWEQGGLLNHNLTAGDYQDSSDFDPSPGVLHVASALCEISVTAGFGNDFVDVSGLSQASVTVYGGDGDDVLRGADTASSFGDRLFGEGGDDDLDGGGGDDLLVGGDGNDRINGGMGHDIIRAGAGDDLVILGQGVDRVDAGGGDDRAEFAAAQGGTVVSSFEGRPVVLSAADGSTGSLFGVANVEHVSVRASGGDDLVEVLDTDANVPVAVEGGGGDDRIVIGGRSVPEGDGARGDLSRIRGVVGVSGDDGEDTIVVLDNGSSVDRDYTIDPTQVRAFAAANGPGGRASVGSVTLRGVERMDLRATDGVNRIDVVPSSETSIRVDGGLPLPGTVPAARGDFLAIDTVTGFPVTSGGGDTSGRTMSVTQRGTGRWEFAQSTARKPVEFSSIERFNHVDRLAVASKGTSESAPVVRVFDAETMSPLFDVPATATYGTRFRGGVQVATGDMDNDGIPDLITAPGAGVKPVIKVFGGTPMSGLVGKEIEGLRLTVNDTFGSRYVGGVNVAVGDVLGDGIADIVVAPMQGRPVIKVFESRLDTALRVVGNAKTPARSFDPFPGWSWFVGGASVATARVDESGKSRIVVGSGAGMPTLVRDFDVRDPVLIVARTYVGLFPRCSGGVRVSAGDVDGDGYDDVLAATWAVGGTWMRARSGLDARTELFSYQMSGRGLTGPVRGVLRDANADGRAELFAAFSAGNPNSQRVVRYRPLSGLSVGGEVRSVAGLSVGRLEIG